MTTRSDIVETAEVRERNARWSEWEASSVAYERAARTKTMRIATIMVLLVVLAAALVLSSELVSW